MLPRSAGVGKGWPVATAFAPVVPISTPLPTGLVNRLMVADIPAQADGSIVAGMTDSAGATFAAAAGAPRYRTGGGKPYIEVSDGDRLLLPVTGGAGATLQALVATQTFTIVHFVENVVDNGRQYATVMGSFSDPNHSLLISATGRRAGIYQGLVPVDYPWTQSGPLAIAQVCDASYFFKAAGNTEQLDRVYLNSSCIYSAQGNGSQAIAADGLGLFGIQNGIGGGNFAGHWRGYLIFDRALSSPEIKQVQKWYSEQVGQPVPWADATAIYTLFGNSLENGYLDNANEFSPMAIIAATDGIPLGCWENLGVSGQNLTGMLANAPAQIYGTHAITGKPHRVMIGEYVNSVRYTGHTVQQTLADIATLVANIKNASAGAKVFVETPPNSDSENGDNHASYDAFVTGLLAAPADGIVRIDLNPIIGRAGDVTNATYYQADKLHLTGAAGDCGYRVKAGIMAPVFAPA